MRSKNPELFNKLSNWAAVVGLIASIMLTLPITLPSWAMVLLSLLVGFCTGIIGTSNIATDDNKIIKKTKEYLLKNKKPLN